MRVFKSQKLILTSLLCSVLAGCVTPQEQLALDDDKCRSFGAMPGSEQYFECRMFVERERNRQEESKRQTQAIQNVAQTLARPRTPAPRPVQPIKICKVTTNGMVCQ